MEKRFPGTLLQSVLLIALGIIFGIPILFLSDFFHQTPAVNEIVVFGFGAAIVASAIFIALIKNKRNGLSVAFNGRLIINPGFISIVGIIISFQLINAPLIQVITNFYSPHSTNFGHLGLVYFIGAILLGPILEELLFRGTILTGMLENYTPRKAILLTALFFALVHGQLLQIIPAFFWGLLFGYVFYKTASIVLVILLHITVNFIGLLSSMIHPYSLPHTFILAYGQYSWLVYGIALIGLIMGSYLLVKKRLFAKYLVEYQKLL